MTKNLAIFFLTVFFITPFFPVSAATIDELQAKISERSNAIADLEKEIAVYQEKLLVAGAEKQTLQAKINELENTRKKLTAELKITENQITSTALSIDGLGLAIGQKEADIITRRQEIAGTIRQIYQLEGNTLVETALSGDFSALWNDLEAMNQLKIKVGEALVAIRGLKADLELDKRAEEAKKPITRRHWRRNRRSRTLLKKNWRSLNLPSTLPLTQRDCQLTARVFYIGRWIMFLLPKNLAQRNFPSPIPGCIMVMVTTAWTFGLQLARQSKLR